MTYNVFGGTLNLTQPSQSVVLKSQLVFFFSRIMYAFCYVLFLCD